MKKIKGISVSEGVAIGKAAIIHREVLHVDRKHIKAENASEELAKFKKDIKIVIAELEHLIQNYAFSQDQKEILSTQKVILVDPEFVDRVNYLISEENCSRENAISIYFTEAHRF